MCCVIWRRIWTLKAVQSWQLWRCCCFGLSPLFLLCLPGSGGILERCFKSVDHPTQFVWGVITSCYVFIQIQKTWQGNQSKFSTIIPLVLVSLLCEVIVNVFLLFFGCFDVSFVARGGDSFICHSAASHQRMDHNLIWTIQPLCWRSLLPASCYHLYKSLLIVIQISNIVNPWSMGSLLPMEWM